MSARILELSNFLRPVPWLFGSRVGSILKLWGNPGGIQGEDRSHLRKRKAAGDGALCVAEVGVPMAGMTPVIRNSKVEAT